MNSAATVLLQYFMSPGTREVRKKKKKEKRSFGFNGKRWIQTAPMFSSLRKTYIEIVELYHNST